MIDDLRVYCSAVHQAYLPIVAVSTCAVTLHYCCNDREFAWVPLAVHGRADHVEFTQALPGLRQLLPQVLLIDAGCEWENYTSDSMFPYAINVTTGKAE